MDPVLAMSGETAAVAVLVFTGVVAPLIGLGLWKLTGGRDAYGGGSYGMLRDVPARRDGPQGKVDPAIQAAEVRQMLTAKAERQKLRGEPTLDVETESARLLAEAEATPAAAHDEELRTEVRQLVVARNERRLRAGMEPLDVEAETDRRLAELGG
jgi:hypothetical protein